MTAEDILLEIPRQEALWKRMQDTQMTDTVNGKPAILAFSGRFRFLSNFWIEEDGLTGEHYYQAAKTLDEGERDWIMSLKSPGEAKREGRKLTLRPDWEDVKVDTMYAVVRAKFIDPVLAQKLLDTGEADLYEGNTWGDYIWGVDLKRLERGEVYGQNLLGKILMQVRAELKEKLDTSRLIVESVAAAAKEYDVSVVITWSGDVVELKRRVAQAIDAVNVVSREVKVVERAPSVWQQQAWDLLDPWEQ